MKLAFKEWFENRYGDKRVICSKIAKRILIFYQDSRDSGPKQPFNISLSQ